MTLIKRFKPTPAMGVALVALFVALGRGATAAGVAITGKHVKNGTRRLAPSRPFVHRRARRRIVRPARRARLGSWKRPRPESNQRHTV